MAKKILLVDDEPLMIKGLKFTLEGDGYETLSAYDGEEALKVFREHTFDLVLLGCHAAQNGWDSGLPAYP